MHVLLSVYQVHHGSAFSIDRQALPIGSASLSPSFCPFNKLPTERNIIQQFFITFCAVQTLHVVLATEHPIPLKQPRQPSNNQQWTIITTTTATRTQCPCQQQCQ